MTENRLAFAVAIPVSNESQNIVPLLERAAAARPVRILVVSDASTDDTDALVRDFSARCAVPIELATSPVRRGKADAVNRIVAAMKGIDVIVMISGDVMPDECCIPRLVAAFDDETVGVAAGRPVPQGPAGVPVVEISRLLWAVHHRIAQASPKSTEITAFRNVFQRIDPDTRTDEAAIEAEVTHRGYRIAYVPDAVILTNSPLLLRDYIKQRTRVTLGHLALARDGYVVGTLSWGQRVRAVGEVWREEGIRLPTLVGGVLLESYVYSAAWLRFRFGPRLGGVWSRIESTKRSFE